MPSMIYGILKISYISEQFFFVFEITGNMCVCVCVCGGGGVTY